jgi:hypothetical protein
MPYKITFRMRVKKQNCGLERLPVWMMVVIASASSFYISKAELPVKSYPSKCS